MIRHPPRSPLFPYPPLSRSSAHKRLFLTSRQLLQNVLDLDMRYHFPANFAEPAQAVGNANKSILIHSRDVSGVVPAVPENLGGFVRLVQIAAHDIWAAHQQQARLIHAKGL